MKKFFSYALIGIIYVYVLSVMGTAVYYNWQYAKNNGFLKWAFFGDIVSTAKAIIWPYYTYEAKYSPVSNNFPEKYIKDRDNFSNSLQMFQQVSDLTHPNGDSETPAAQVNEAKVISITQQGIDLSQTVSDDFLDYMSPDLKNYYRNKLVKGETLFLEGLKGDTTNVNSTGSQEEIEGVSLQTEWNNWWQIHSQTLANKAFPS